MLRSLQQIHHALPDVVVGSPVTVEGFAVGLMAREHRRHDLESEFFRIMKKHSLRADCQRYHVFHSYRLTILLSRFPFRHGFHHTYELFVHLCFKLFHYLDVA